MSEKAEQMNDGMSKQRRVKEREKENKCGRQGHRRKRSTAQHKAASV